MLSVLIIDEPVDAHTFALKWALEKCGIEATHFAQVDFPQRSTATFDSERNCFEISINERPTSTFDVVWNRRISPVRPSDLLHAGDFALAQQIGGEFLKSLHDFHAGRAFWINDPTARERANRKVNQLVAARSAGLAVPRTLVSNDPEKIRRFMENTSVVAKPLQAMRWDAGDQWVNMRTTRMTADMISSDIAVQSCPMIYQEEVQKVCEYRVVVLGAEVIGVEIDSQSNADAKLDWRDADTAALGLKPVTLPAELRQKILNFMSSMGLVFGSLDLALGPAGEVVFFEVNEQGNFLWLEGHNPDVFLLDRMVQFILSRDLKFVYERRGRPISFHEYLASGARERFTDEAARDHMPGYGIFCPKDGAAEPNARAA